MDTMRTKQPWLKRLHRDQRGSIGILSVFAVLLLTMLMGMLMNVGRETDGKLRLQNAADDAAYSGGVVMARAMNTLAFTNHLLSDVFAVTAFMREARDRNAESYVSPILAAWLKVAPVFAKAPFPKFQALGQAIAQKVPREQALVRAYSEWAAASSRQILPLMEEILAEELIPKYQRAVVEAFPDIAQSAAMEVARRNGVPDRGRGPLLGVLWRTNGLPVGLGNEVVDRTLPVVDPVLDVPADQAQRINNARRQRDALAHRYLNGWNAEALAAFDSQAKMSQFGALWRSFTCGYLQKLLEEEYPNSNLPHVILAAKEQIDDPQSHLEKYYTFIAVAYWRKLPQLLPGLFKHPLQGDAVAYAEVHLFIPRQRLDWHWVRPGGAAAEIPIGGVPGEFPGLPVDNPANPGAAPGGAGRWTVGREGVPTQWDLWNQNWTCRLAPATQPALATILQTPPPLPAFAGQNITLPNLGGLSSDDIRWISTH